MGGELNFMKSSKEDLKRRGFIDIEDITKFQQWTNEELIKLINSPKPTERSVAVNLLSKQNCIKNLEFVKIILERLCVEKCLYTKIEICTALEKGCVETAKQMIKYLGFIGKNQHLCLPNRVSKKNSYPLPRDIIARSLGRMDYTILPVLLEVLNSNEEGKISEVIDAIGFMLYYNQDYNNEDSFQAIINTMNHYSENNIIVWKCVSCLSSFWTQDSIDVLNGVLDRNVNDMIKDEARRSLRIIGEKCRL